MKIRDVRSSIIMRRSRRLGNENRPESVSGRLGGSQQIPVLGLLITLLQGRQLGLFTLASV